VSRFAVGNVISTFKIVDGVYEVLFDMLHHQEERENAILVFRLKPLTPSEID
jgi:hypothetical protein